MKSFLAVVNGFFLAQWQFLLILALGLALRFYRLPEMASYDFDQEYVTNFVLDVVRVYPVRFIGQGLSVEGLFMGPWYFYSLVPFYLLTDLSPIGGAIGSVLFGGAIIAASYFVAAKIFSRNVGLVAALLRAVSFSAIAADWSMVPSYTSDIMILGFLLLFYWLWQNRKKLSSVSWKDSVFWILPALFFLFGMLTSFHPIHFHFGLVFLVLWALWKIRFSLRNWLVALIAFLVPVTPLLAFEALRNFAMTRQLFTMFTGGEAGSKAEEFSSDRLVYIAKAFVLQWLELWQLGKEYRLAAALFLGGVVVFALWQLRLHAPRLFRFVLPSFGCIFLITFAYYLFFPTHVPEYYLRCVQVLLLLLLAYTLVRLWMISYWGKAVALVLLTLFVGKNLLELQSVWGENRAIRLASKESVVRHIIEQAKGEPFQVSYVTEPGWQYGYKSLFRVYDVEPGERGPVYTIVAPATFVQDDELEFISGKVGVNYPD